MAPLYAAHPDEWQRHDASGDLEQRYLVDSVARPEHITKTAHTFHDLYRWLTALYPGRCYSYLRHNVPRAGQSALLLGFSWQNNQQRLI